MELSELVDALTALAAERPVFHSEADFQHGFAWQLHALQPELGSVLRLGRNRDFESMSLRSSTVRGLRSS